MTLGFDPANEARERSFDDLVEQHGSRLFRLAYLILQDVGLAEDALQDALLRAWRQLPTVRSTESLDSWLTSIVLNASRDQARRARVRRFVPRLIPGQLPSTDPQHQIQVVDQVHRALRTIGEKHRVVLVLRYYMDLELSTIAAQLRVPEGTVRSRIHHGLRALRAAIEAQDRDTND